MNQLPLIRHGAKPLGRLIGADVAMHRTSEFRFMVHLVLFTVPDSVVAQQSPVAYTRAPIIEGARCNRNNGIDWRRAARRYAGGERHGNPTRLPAVL
jgi:hypothetical protein